MRPLHRPMFRYGGPIKEGVMSGIREPQAKHTVGSSIWPQTDGRTHQGKIGTGGNILSKVPGGSSIVSKISSSTKDLFPRIGQWWRNIKPSYRTQPGVVTGGTSHKGIYGTGASGTKAKYISQTMPPVSKMSKIKAFAKENPWWTYGGAGAGVSSGVVPTVAGGIADLGWRGVKQVGDLLVWDKIFDQDKWEAERKAKKELENELKTTTETNPWKDKYEALLAANETPQKSDDERRAERIQKYRDIMDIKGMNKEAAYDSLIAASKAVGESGDFKGDIKSGKLINDIIQSTSKQFDKPSDMKKAIDTLILKGEIQKDIAGAKPSQYEIKEDYLTGNLGAVIGKRVSLQKPGTLSDALLLTKGTDTKTNRTSQALRSYFDGYLTPKFEGIISSDKIKKLGGKEKLIEGESISLDNGVYQVSKGYILVEDNKIIKQEDLFTGKD